jgi:murein DD-endopeptidase MepM/ murein hydrolase activator NlpD
MGKVRTSDPNGAVGASLVHPDTLVAAYDEYTFDGIYGFTLWRKQEPESAQHYEGGIPVVRVALAYDLQPEQIEPTVQDKLEVYSHLPISRQKVSVSERGLKGVVIGPIPGSTPSLEVYVPVEDRVYQFKIYKEQMDTEGEELLASLKFGPVSRSVESLNLLDAGVPETFYAEDNQELIELERSARAAARSKLSPEEALEAAALPQFPESQIGEGCWRAASSFFVQTQHGRYANSRTGDDISTGYTILGRPNYWGQFTHGNYEYGRCVHTYWTNDMYAIDFPLAVGDWVYSPFRKAKVTWAGSHDSYKNYGIFVVTQAYDSSGTSLSGYWNMSAHLSAIKKGIRPGEIVTDEDIIGYAGATGDPSIPVGEPHLHSAFYRYPQNNGGRPYGGQGLQILYHHYVGTAAGTGPGVYRFGWQASSTTKAQGSLISN